MSFNQAEPKTPTAVTPLRLQIIINDNPAESTLEYAWEVLDQDGNVMARRAGNGVPHLTPQEKQNLLDMATRWRALQVGTLPAP